MGNVNSPVSPALPQSSLAGTSVVIGVGGRLLLVVVWWRRVVRVVEGWLRVVLAILLLLLRIACVWQGGATGRGSVATVGRRRRWLLCIATVGRGRRWLICISEARPVL